MSVIAVRVLLFSHIQYALGESEMTLSFNGDSTAGDVVKAIRTRLPDNLKDLPLKVAVNQVYVHEDTVLQSDDEIALLPPVQGG